MREVYRSAYHEVRVVPESHLLRIQRSSTPYATVDAIPLEIEALAKAVSDNGITFAKFRLLVDMRAGPLRNDPSFEKVAGTAYDRLTRRFQRYVLLMRTATGVLQIKR